MEDTPLRTKPIYVKTLVHHGTDWSAIWGGVFVFAAIWAVFEMLAVAIFAGQSNAANLTSGMGAGMAIWTIVLTIIAMYVAGRATGQMAGAITRSEGLMHGMMMFGLSIVSALVLDILAGVSTAGNASTTGLYIHHAMSIGAEWTAFIALFLGWLAAMGGASTGVQQQPAESRHSVQMRPAA